MSAGDEARWLVRCGGKVLGPYTPQQVVRKIRSQEIQVTDEAAVPYSRWLPLKDHPQMKQAVALILEEIALADDLTATTGLGEEGMTESVTGKPDEITQRLKVPADLTQEIVLSHVEETTNASSPGVQARFQEQGNRVQRAVQEDADRSSMWLWLLTIFIFAGVGGILWWRSPLNPATTAGESPADSGLELFAQGNFEQALLEMLKVSSTSPRYGDIQIPMAQILIHRGRTAEARRVLGPLIGGERDVAVTKILALADMKDGDFKLAEKKLEKVLLSTPTDVSARINLGFSQLELKRDEDAMARFQSLLDEGHRQIELLEGYFLMALRAYEQGRSDRDLVDARRLLDAARKADPLLEADSLLGQARSIKALPSGERIDAVIRSLMDGDLELSFERIEDVSIYSDSIRKFWFGETCQTVEESVEDLNLRTMLSAFCALKLGKIQEVQTKISNLIEQSPKDPLVHGFYAFALSRTGRQDEASVARGRALDLNRKGELLMPIILQARFCTEKSDWECAEEQWKRAQLLRSDLPSIRLGMARVALARNQVAEARKLVDELEIERNAYRPLRVFESQLRQVGVSR